MDFDHAVIVVKNLEQAVADYRDLGFTISPGGEHADGHTHNALIPFADGAYLELIAFHAGVNAPDHPWWSAAEAGGGLVDWAIRVDDLAAQTRRLQAVGLPFESPRDGGRLRPDGAQLLWKSLRPAPGSELPFLIEDVTPRSLRVPSGAAAEHPNGVRGLEAIVVAVRDIDAAARQYSALLGVQAADAAPDPLLAASARTLRCGASRVTLTSATVGPIGERIGRLGSGPYALFLHTAAERTGWLDSQLTHGAPIHLRQGPP